MENVDDRLIMDYCKVVYLYHEIKDCLILNKTTIDILYFLDDNDYDYIYINTGIYDIKKDDIVFTIVEINDKWYLDSCIDFITYDCENINTSIEEIEKTLAKMLDK